MANIHTVSEYPSDAKNGACYLCGAIRRDDETEVIDTGVYVDYPEKRLCLCPMCVRYMAHLLGYPSQEEVDKAFQDRDDAIAETKRTQKDLQRHLDAEEHFKGRLAGVDQVIGRLLAAEKKAK